jgi:AcrR family transcriptional regulator
VEPTTDTRASELGRRDRQREETRRRLFDAALTVFRRDGVGPARIEDIADLAGVSRGSFYFHFPTKDDVLAELLRESGERVAAEVDSVQPQAPLDDVLAAVSTALAREWEKDLKIFPDIATVSLRLGATPPLSENQRTLRARLAQRFATARERGELVDDAPPVVLTDVFLINQCTAAIAWSGRPTIPLEAALQGMAKLFMHGAHRGNG